MKPKKFFNKIGRAIAPKRSRRIAKRRARRRQMRRDFRARTEQKLARGKEMNRRLARDPSYLAKQATPFK